MSMNTVALEMVPPNVDGGLDRAAEELRKLRQFSAEFGIDRRIAHVMIPSMIVEDGDRPGDEAQAGCRRLLVDYPG